MCVVVRREKEMILKKNMVSSVYLIIQKGALCVTDEGEFGLCWAKKVVF